MHAKESARRHLEQDSLNAPASAARADSFSKANASLPALRRAALAGLLDDDASSIAASSCSSRKDAYRSYMSVVGSFWMASSKAAIAACLCKA